MKITNPNQSQTVLAANTAPTRFILQNTSLFAIFVGTGTPATNDGDSLILAPGEAVDSSTPGFSVALDLNVFAPQPGATVALKKD